MLRWFSLSRKMYTKGAATACCWVPTKLPAPSTGTSHTLTWEQCILNFWATKEKVPRSRLLVLWLLWWKAGIWITAPSICMPEQSSGWALSIRHHWALWLDSTPHWAPIREQPVWQKYFTFPFIPSLLPASALSWYAKYIEPLFPSTNMSGIDFNFP